ncbi:hypothetical protein ACWEU6_34905 [Streptosporangium sandarakinum]|uniref:hypothetical protein n=1 Tax=Streptosporangium sandarakinum TaxID=1260955 RepID=UPI0036BBC199
MLRCPVGAADVMRHRFDHLQEVASRPWPTALFSGGVGSTNKPSMPAHSARGAGAVHTTAAVIDQQPPRRHVLPPGPPLIHPASGPR